MSQDMKSILAGVALIACAWCWYFGAKITSNWFNDDEEDDND